MQQALLIGKSGIVASDPGVIHSALLLTERHEPHFIAVIDKLQANKEPAIYKTTQMPACYHLPVQDWSLTWRS
eukprot:scaffold70701_cov19-Tisochrysis_lutea.AAC.3